MSANRCPECGFHAHVRLALGEHYLSCNTCGWVDARKYTPAPEAESVRTYNWQQARDFCRPDDRFVVVEVHERALAAERKRREEAERELTATQDIYRLRGDAIENLKTQLTEANATIDRLREEHAELETKLGEWQESAMKAERERDEAIDSVQRLTAGGSLGPIAVDLVLNRARAEEIARLTRELDEAKRELTEANAIVFLLREELDSMRADKEFFKEDLQAVWDLLEEHIGEGSDAQDFEICSGLAAHIAGRVFTLTRQLEEKTRESSIRNRFLNERTDECQRLHRELEEARAVLRDVRDLLEGRHGMFYDIGGRPAVQFDSCERMRANADLLAPQVDALLSPERGGEKHTPDEWIQITGCAPILDPDGWRDKDAPSYETPLTFDAFQERYLRCTLEAGQPLRRPDLETDVTGATGIVLPEKPDAPAEIPEPKPIYIEGNHCDHCGDPLPYGANLRFCDQCVNDPDEAQVRAYQTQRQSDEDLLKAIEGRLALAETEMTRNHNGVESARSQVRDALVTIRARLAEGEG